jgi:putative FmdB family regulatory protein
VGLPVVRAAFDSHEAAESYAAMPIYEYDCKNCGIFEVTQRITEGPLTSCPSCDGDVHRLISLTSFVLKGSGWYATDYARSNGKSESSGESSGKEGAANGSSDKSAASSSEPSKTSPAESSKSSSDKSASAK